MTTINDNPYYYMFMGQRIRKQLFDKGNTYSLRGICMICIIIHHLYQQSVLYYDFNYYWILKIILEDMGIFAVGVFFLLSGYGVFDSLRKNDPIGIQYITTRILKLICPFLFVWLIDSTYHTIQNSTSFECIFHCLATLSIPSALLWFMKVIFCLYLVTYLISIVVKDTRERVFWIFLVVLSYYFVSAFILKLDAFWWKTVLCFPVGALCNEYKEHIRCSVNYRIARIILLFAFLLSFYYVLFSYRLPLDEIMLNNLNNIVWVISTVSFALLSICYAPIISINSKILHFIGANSICFYLFHIFCLQFKIYIPNFWIYSIMVIIGATLMVAFYVIVQKFILFRDQHVK